MNSFAQKVRKSYGKFAKFISAIRKFIFITTNLLKACFRLAQKSATLKKRVQNIELSGAMKAECSRSIAQQLSIANQITGNKIPFFSATLFVRP